MRVLLSGASGMIGSSLVRASAGDRIHVFTVVRRKSTADDEILWDPAAESPFSEPERLEDLDAVVHLAGANVAAHRWTAAYKQEILDSRVGTTRKLAGVLKRLKRPPRVLLCASATGIYGDRGNEVLHEDSLPGQGFLAETCKAWEAAADEAKEAGIRVVHLRFGVVLTKDGGALAKMLPVFRAGLGGKLGSGRQWMSWISLRDLDRAISYLMQNEGVSGAVNLTAPQPVTNAEFTHSLGRALHRPAVFAVPGFALRMALGEMADEGLLASARAVPERLNGAGFVFEDADMDAALHSILRAAQAT
jgi:uncharacterized protein (TIGR01777 family)